MGPFFSVCVELNQVFRQLYQEICRTSRFHITEWVRQPPPSTWWLRHLRHMEARSRAGKGGREACRPREVQALKSLWHVQPHRTSQAAATRKTGKQSSWVLRKVVCPLAHNPSSPQPRIVTHTLPLRVPSHKTLFSTNDPSTSQRFE